VKTALVTGATGLLGQSLTRELLASQWRVRGLVRLSTAGLPRGVEAVSGDVTAPLSLAAAVEECDAVFHCAAAVGDAVGAREMWRVNVDGTRHMLEAAVAAGVPRFVYASSVAVYGRRSGVYPEDTPLGDPGNPYGRTKAAAEKLLLSEVPGDAPCTAVIVRPTNIYGLGDRHLLGRVVALLTSKRAALIDGGRGRLNLVYADDVAALMKAAAEVPAPRPIYNVTGPDRITWREFVELLSSCLELSPPHRDISRRTAMAVAACLEGMAALRLLRRPPLSRFAVDLVTGNRSYPIDRARTDLDFEPAIDLQEGLARVLPELRSGVISAAAG
jgi:nucleoside-diphosphate-sugar epimerase